MNDEDIRYPIGRFDFKAPFRLEDRPRFLVQLAEAPGRLTAAVAGLSEQQLDTVYRTEGWTVRQVAHHLADARRHRNAAPHRALC